MPGMKVSACCCIFWGFMATLLIHHFLLIHSGLTNCLLYLRLYHSHRLLRNYMPTTDGMIIIMLLNMSSLVALAVSLDNCFLLLLWGLALLIQCTPQSPNILVSGILVIAMSWQPLFSNLSVTPIVFKTMSLGGVLESLIYVVQSILLVFESSSMLLLNHFQILSLSPRYMLPSQIDLPPGMIQMLVLLFSSPMRLWIWKLLRLQMI